MKLPHITLLQSIITPKCIVSLNKMVITVFLNMCTPHELMIHVGLFSPFINALDMEHSYNS